MQVSKIEKLLKSELKKILKGYEFQDKYFYFSYSEYKTHKISFKVTSFGGDMYLHLTSMIRINHIEDKWFKFKNDLLIFDNYFQPTFYNTFNHIDKSKFPPIHSLGLSIEDSDNWLKNIVESILKNYYLPFCEKLDSIHLCDQIINNELNINEETLKISPIEVLPFRKVLIAEEAQNPKLEEIKKTMYKYCEEQYELGKKENFEKLCKIKPVFETLFGKF